MDENEFVLGTAQLGSKYGRTNDVGHLSESTALSLLEHAYALGVRTVDTARAYGVSERRIGQFLKTHGIHDLQVLTKLAPFDPALDLSDPSLVRLAIAQSVETSLECLKVDHLSVVMLHRAAYLDDFGALILDTLGHFQTLGQIGQIGVSVNDPQQANSISKYERIRHIQLPFNLLDRRWVAHAVPAIPTIHARSVFLQGLLAKPDIATWPIVSARCADEIRSALKALVTRLGRMDIRDLAVAYARSQDWISGLVIGVESADQLTEVWDLFCHPRLTANESTYVQTYLPEVPETLVQPWMW